MSPFANVVDLFHFFGIVNWLKKRNTEEKFNY